MGMPKPQISVTKKGVTYKSEVEAYKYCVDELQRGANRDIAKLIKTETKRKMKDKSPIFKKNLQSWNKKNGELEIGYKRKHPGFYAWFYETGTKKNNREESLIITAEENIGECERIIAHYYKNYLGDLVSAQNVINENEDISDD